MRRIVPILGVLVGFMLAASAVSQDKGGDKKLKGQLPPGFKSLNLSKAQVEKIYGLQMEYKDKIKKLEDEIKSLKADLKKAEVDVLWVNMKLEVRPCE